jgi:hypothetical protein
MEVPKGLAKCNPAIPPRRRTVNVSEHAAQKGTGKTSSTGRLGGSLIRNLVPLIGQKRNVRYRVAQFG